MPYYKKRGGSQSYRKAKKRKVSKQEYSFAGNKIPSSRILNRDSGNQLIVPAVRTCTLISNAAYTAPANFGALSFKLADLPNYTEYTNLYDEYRIKAVKVMFLPTLNSNVELETSGTSSSLTTIPSLYTWIDNDDNTAPTAITQGQQFQSFKCHGLLDRMRQRSLVPECSTALYSGTFTSYGQVKNQWIDNNSPSVVHFGLKFGIINCSNNGAFDVVLTYYLEFRKTT